MILIPIFIVEIDPKAEKNHPRSMVLIFITAGEIHLHCNQELVITELPLEFAISGSCCKLLQVTHFTEFDVIRYHFVVSLRLFLSHNYCSHGFNWIQARVSVIYGVYQNEGFCSQIQLISNSVFEDPEKLSPWQFSNQNIYFRGFYVDLET